MLKKLKFHLYSDILNCLIFSWLKRLHFCLMFRSTLTNWHAFSNDCSIQKVERAKLGVEPFCIVNILIYLFIVCFFGYNTLTNWLDSRFCCTPWRCHYSQQYPNSKCQLVLGSGNLSNKIQKYSLGQCVWKPWRCTICMADGVVFSPWNSSTYLPSSQLDIFRLACCMKCGVKRLVTNQSSLVTGNTPWVCQCFPGLWLISYCFGQLPHWSLAYCKLV